MRSKLLIMLIFLLMSCLIGSCKDEDPDEKPLEQNWITIPEYDFPIFISNRGGIVTTDLEAFDVTGFLEVGDSTAFGDTLEWKVLRYSGRQP